MTFTMVQGVKMLVFWGMLDGGMDLDVCGPFFAPTAPIVDRECAYVDVPTDRQGETLWLAITR